MLQIVQFFGARLVVPQSPQDRYCKLHIYLRTYGRLTPALDRLRLCLFLLTCGPLLTQWSRPYGSAQHFHDDVTHAAVIMRDPLQGGYTTKTRSQSLATKLIHSSGESITELCSLTSFKACKVSLPVEFLLGPTQV